MEAALAVVAVVFAGALLRKPRDCRHRWEIHPAQTNSSGTYGPYQMCKRCQKFYPVIPAGHPESLTAELTPTEEAALAELDARLWPEEAK